MTAPGPDTMHNPRLLPDAKVAWLHLLEVGGDGTIAQGAPPFLYISTLLRAQREMNSAREQSNTQMIVPLLAAFAILDQLGECYGFSETLPGEPPANAPIKRALHHFPLPWGTLSADEMHALYMMRNGLMHDAAFSSIERGGQKRSMIFRHDIRMEKMVVLPVRDWNGKPDDVCRETITWVNPDLLIWVANSAIGRCGQALKLGDPNLEIRHDPQVIAARYLLWHRHSPSSVADDEAEWLKPGRHELRKELRSKLTAAEVARHAQRYYPT
jgi:hypothetical protein